MPEKPNTPLQKKLTLANYKRGILEAAAKHRKRMEAKLQELVNRDRDSPYVTLAPTGGGQEEPSKKTSTTEGGQQEAPKITHPRIPARKEAIRRPPSAGERARPSSPEEGQGHQVQGEGQGCPALQDL